MNILIGALLVIYVIVCTLMIVAILMQRPKQEGLGAAFGGGLTDSIFGAQTSQVLVNATVWLTTVFFVLSVTLAFLYGRRASSSSIQKELLSPDSALSQSAQTKEANVPMASDSKKPASTPEASSAIPSKSK